MSSKIIQFPTPTEIITEITPTPTPKPRRVKPVAAPQPQPRPTLPGWSLWALWFTAGVIIINMM